MLFIIFSWCFVGYTLANEGSTPLILVNRMVLDTDLKKLEHSITEKQAEYYYTNNEMTEVSCINTNKACHVHLYYDYAETLHDNFKRSKFSSRLGIGFRLKLKEIHDKSQMVCKSSCYDRQSIVKVTFISKTESTDTAYFNLEINGLTARGIISKLQTQQNIYNISYKYFRRENIHIIANTVHSDTNIQCGVNHNKDVKTVKLTESNIELIIDIKKNETLSCSIMKANEEWRSVRFEIHFTRLPILRDSQELMLSLPKDNIILEMFEYEGNKLIYYEYERNDYITINCSSKYKDFVVYVKFNNTDSHNKGIVFKDRVQLTSDSEYTLECFTRNILERSILVMLHKREHCNTIRNTILVGGAVIFILIIICIVYKCKRKNVENNVVVFNNTEGTHENISIPTQSNQLTTQNTGPVLVIVPENILKDSVASTNKKLMTPATPIYANFQSRPRGNSDSFYCDYVEPCYSTYNPKRN